MLPGTPSPWEHNGFLDPTPVSDARKDSAGSPAASSPAPSASRPSTMTPRSLGPLEGGATPRPSQHSFTPTNTAAPALPPAPSTPMGDAGAAVAVGAAAATPRPCPQRPEKSPPPLPPPGRTDREGGDERSLSQSVSPPPLTASSLRFATPRSFASVGCSPQSLTQKRRQEPMSISLHSSPPSPQYRPHGEEAGAAVASAFHGHHRELFFGPLSPEEHDDVRDGEEATKPEEGEGEAWHEDPHRLAEEQPALCGGSETLKGSGEDHARSSLTISTLSDSEGEADGVGERTRKREEGLREEDDGQAGQAKPQGRQALSAAEEEAILKSLRWRPCPHGHGAPRYRNTPGYYCTYCTYSVCEGCFESIPKVLLLGGLPHTDDDDDDDDTAEGRRRERGADDDGRCASSPMAAVGSLAAALSSPAAADVQSPSQTPGIRLGTRAHRKRRGPSRCHLCQEGYLVFEDALLHEWSCEGPAPELRVRKRSRVAYDTEMLQRYHLIKGHRERRATSTAPLLAAFHFAVPPPPPLPSPDTKRANADTCTPEKGACLFTVEERGVPDLDADLPLRPASDLHAPSAGSPLSPSLARPHLRVNRLCCEEGGAFVFSVENHRLEQPCVWCGLNLYPREVSPAFAKAFPIRAGDVNWVASGSVTPLVKWQCPPSLPGLPPRRFLLSVPHGSYGLYNIHGVALYPLSSIFQKATTHLAATTTTAGLNGRLTAAKHVPSQHAQPLLVVDILHRIASSPLVDRRLWCKRPASASTPEATPPLVPWPDGLASEELALCVDHLLQGRSVAVGGLGSKYFFLHHVAHSAELMHFSIVVADASQGRAGSLEAVERQLRDLSRKLHAGATAPAASRFLPAATGGEAAALRPGAKREREEGSRGGSPRSVLRDAADADHPVSSSNRASVNRATASPPTAAAVEAAGSGFGGGSGANEEEECPLQLIPYPGGSGGGLSSSTPMRWRFPLTTPGTRLAPLPPSGSLADGALCPVKEPPISFATAAARRSIMGALFPLASSRRRCLRWLAPPSTTAHRLVCDKDSPRSTLGARGSTPAQSAATILVLHNVDLLDPKTLAVLRQLCSDHGYPRSSLRLLLSYDDPNWPSGGNSSGSGSVGPHANGVVGGGLSATFSSSGLAGMCLVHVQLRSLLLPRVHEMRLVDALALLTQSEATAAGGGGRRGGGGAFSSSASLPLHDTIRRVLKSLPDSFHGHLAKLIDIQEAYGEGVRISVHAIRAELERRDVMMSVGLWGSVRGELTSNRLACYDTAENALVVLQPKKLRKVLEEVVAEKKTKGVLDR